MSHRIMFWNTQRLSEKSPEDKLHLVCKSIAESNADDVFLCEVLDSLVEAQTYRRNEGKRQLGIGQINEDFVQAISGEEIVEGDYFSEEDFIYSVPVLDVSVPEEYRKYRFKGGMNFGKIADRKPCFVDRLGIKIVVWHAPASHNATKTLLMLVLSLIANLGEGALWLIVGDLNVDPDVLKRTIEARIKEGAVDEEIANKIISYIKYSNNIHIQKLPTHFRHEKKSTLDYMITNVPDVNIWAQSETTIRIWMPNFFEHFDHVPIYVDLPSSPVSRSVVTLQPGGGGVVRTPVPSKPKPKPMKLLSQEEEKDRKLKSLARQVLRERRKNRNAHQVKVAPQILPQIESPLILGPFADMLAKFK